ncbi:MAG TPA: hypothetical protein VI248_04520 [Kineosporiaceae bacterium]
MNVQSKGARRTLAAVCSAAVVAAGASFFAAPAHAAGVTLAYGPTSTSATITNLNPLASAANAATAYGLKVTGATASDPDPMRLSVLTGPTGGSVSVERRAGNGAPTSARIGVTAATTVNGGGAAGGGNTIPVADETGFSVGDWIVLLGTTSATTEFAQVSAVAANTLTTNTNLVNTHASGKVVYDLGAPDGTATTLPGDESGNASVTVAAATGFAVGDWVRVDGDADAVAKNDIRQITAISGTTFTLNAALQGGGLHGAGDDFVKLGSTGTGASAAAAGDTSLTVTTSKGISAGDSVLVSDGTTNETALVSAVPDATTLTLADPLGFAHAVGSLAVKLQSTAVGFSPVAVGYSHQVVNYSTSTNSDNMYLAATKPGTYTLQFYKDRNGNSVYDSSQDDAAPVFTLTVKDVNTTTADTSDDLAPVLTVPPSVTLGQTITPTVSLGGLSSIDTRGSSGSPSVGVLGSALATASAITFTNNSGIGGGGAGTRAFDGTNIYRQSDVAGVADTDTTTFTIGSGITRTAQTTFVDNTVNSVAEDVTNVVGTVKDDAGAGARTVHIKTGTGTVTYTATVKHGGTVVSGALVYFTLTTGTHSPGLTADGTLVSSNSTTKVYSAVSDSDGVATLKVTSDTTTAGTTYTVLPSSNTHDGDLLSASYETVAATTLENTNSAASLLVTPGSSATLTGRLLDQFDAPFVPTGSDPLQVAVRIPAGGATDGNAALSGGSFSYTYTPATTPTAGTQTSFDFYYNATTPVDGTDSAINWASTATPASVTITAPVASATVTQKAATAAHGAGTVVTGSTLDASSAGLAYKVVTLSGTPGVYFSTVANPTTSSTDDLKTSLDVATNGSGAYTAYAFFTRIGTATITATSGTATKSVDVSVTQTADPYKVVAIDSAVQPGGTSVVSGRVENGFGFPVSGAQVDLSLGASTLAALGATSVTTSSDGVWSTTLSGASDGDGQATLTATLHGQTTNVTADTTWLDDAGLTIPHGEYQDTATITVDPNINRTTVSAPASHAGAGMVRLTGHAKPGATVEVYAKPTGTSTPFALVGVATAGTDGDWSDSEYVARTTTFYAKTTVSSSSTVTVVVTAPSHTPRDTIAKAGCTALGSGKVAVSITGNGNGRTVVTVYQLVGTKWVKVTTVKVSSKGAASAKVKLGKGKRTLKLVYATPGKTATSKTVTVTVK